MHDIILTSTGTTITVRTLPSGDIAIWHRPDENTRRLVEPICRGSGYWDSTHTNWVVFARFKDAVLKELRATAH